MFFGARGDQLFVYSISKQTDSIMFPDELMDQYRLAMVRFKKTQKALFR